MGFTLGFYLLRHFLSRVALALGGFTGVLLVFDLLANGDEVVQGSGRVFLPLMYYALLRLPEITVLILPLAVLVGAMLSLGQLAMRQELIAAMAGGVPARNFTFVLLFGGALLGAGQFAIVNLLLPDTAAELRLWSDDSYYGLPKESETKRLPAWFSAGNTLLHASGAAPHKHTLYGVTVIVRDEHGMMKEKLEAEQAGYCNKKREPDCNGEMILYNVTRQRFGDPAAIATPDGKPDNAKESLQVLQIPLNFRQSELAILADTVQELRFKELRKLEHQTDEVARVDDFYAVSLQRRLADPAGVLVMILLAMPIAFQLPRRNRLAVVQSMILAGGFVFLIAERMLQALGESGNLPPLPAAWLPAGSTAIAALVVLYRLQHPPKTRSDSPPSMAAAVA